MKQKLREAIAQSLAAATGLEKDSALRLLEQPKNPAHGDVAFPCFLVAKDRKIPPPACAQQIKESIVLPEGISDVTTAGPFLNFRFDRAAFAAAVIRDTLVAPGAVKPAAPKTVIVEYSSPNIAKPFHVGHLRATLIGNCLDRLHRHLGHNTISINHLGDWGTQFGFVWAGCNLWGKPKNNSVVELLETYRRATGLKEEQEKSGVPEGGTDINAMARQYFLDLEEGKDYAVEFWRWCSDISLAYFKETYRRLDVAFDHYTGESFYSDKLDGVRIELEQAGILIDSKGALGVDLGEQLGFARVFTPDGRSLYLTRDIATAEYRAETFKFDQAIYVVGAPQTLHFQQLKAILERLGHQYAAGMIHVAFGHVMGIRTRGEGQFIELNEFIDEAVERALEAYRTQVSKRPEGLDEQQVAEAVGLSAIIFSNLCRSNIKDVHFSWEQAFAFQGDSGPYLLYAYARINGIKERALEAGINLPDSISAQYLPEESAFLLSSAIADFEDQCTRAALESEPSILTTYALDLAKLVSRAYLDLKVVGCEPAAAQARLGLFEAARVTLGKTLRLLGIPALERM